jgi:hypothetical protein
MNCPIQSVPQLRSDSFPCLVPPRHAKKGINSSVLSEKMQSRLYTDTQVLRTDNTLSRLSCCGLPIYHVWRLYTGGRYFRYADKRYNVGNPQQLTLSQQSRTNWSLIANATWRRLWEKNGSWSIEGTNRVISSDGRDGTGNMTSGIASTTWKTQWSWSTRSTISTLGPACLQGRRPRPSRRLLLVLEHSLQFCFSAILSNWPRDACSVQEILGKSHF